MSRTPGTGEGRRDDDTRERRGAASGGHRGKEKDVQGKILCSIGSEWGLRKRRLTGF